MIISKIQGGLGNQMFQFAAGLALARKYNVELRLDLFQILDQRPWHSTVTKRNYALDIFQYSFPIATKLEVLRHTIPFGLNRYAAFLIKEMRPNGRNYYHENCCQYCDIPSRAYIEGYWQNASYFKEIKDELKKIFILRNELINKNSILLDKIHQAKNPVCIAFRRGDYIGHPTLDIVTMDYYHKALELLDTIIPERQLFIFSDDIDWCEINFNLSGEHIIFARSESIEDSMIQDFYAICQCHYFIIPNSTFHYWGAWLAPFRDKVVIAPKAWNRQQVDDVHPILPKEWKAL